MGRDGDLRWVYGAAATAAADERAACAAASAALATASSRGERMLVAVRAALADAPCEPLASLPIEEREPVALARILSMDVDSIAAVLGCDRDEVKARMRAGLARLAASVAPVNLALVQL